MMTKLIQANSSSCCWACSSLTQNYRLLLLNWFTTRQNFLYHSSAALCPCCLSARETLSHLLSCPDSGYMSKSQAQIVHMGDCIDLSMCLLECYSANHSTTP